MISNINLIIAAILFLSLIILKIFISRKFRVTQTTKLYYYNKKLTIFLIISSFLVFITSLIINIYQGGNDPSFKATINYLLNSLSIAILIFPFSILTLYKTSFKDEELISHTKTIVTNIYNPSFIKKFNRAGINVIILSSQNISSRITSISPDEIESRLLRKNLHIQTDNHEILKKQMNKETTIYEFNDLQNVYCQLQHARGVHDNYIRSIKYLILTYLPLLLSYYFLTIINFPITYNILTIIILKIYTSITSGYVYKHLPYDTDIIERKPKPYNVFIGKQELIFTIIESFCVFFILNVPYMFVFVENGSQEFANTLFYTIFITINLFYTLSIISDSNFIKNLFKSIRCLPLIIYIIISISLTILINFTNLLNTTNIGWHNYISCLLFSVIAISINELIKLARFTTTKGRKKCKSK